MGVGRSADKEAEVTGSRLRVRATPRPSPPLSGGRDRRGDLPTAVPATSPGVHLREDRKGTSAGSGASEVPSCLGGLPKGPTRQLRPSHQDGRPSGAPQARVESTPPWGQAEADPGRGGSAAGVHGLHREGAGVDQAVLPHPGGSFRGRGAVAQNDLRCPICGSGFDLTVDHVLPRALGGPDSPTNRRWLCRRCNSVKGPRIVSDDALRSYRSFERLTRRMGLGLDPPPLGCVGPSPILNRLAQFARARTLQGGT